MHLRSALFLMTAAGSLVPTGAGGGSGPSHTDGNDQGSSSAPPVVTKKPEDDKPADKSASKLRAEWKDKRFADIAAHHNTLLASGHVDEAAEFHAAVVKTFKDKK